MRTTMPAAGANATRSKVGSPRCWLCQNSLTDLDGAPVESRPWSTYPPYREEAPRPVRTCSMAPAPPVTSIRSSSKVWVKFVFVSSHRFVLYVCGFPVTPELYEVGTAPARPAGIVPLSTGDQDPDEPPSSGGTNPTVSSGSADWYWNIWKFADAVPMLVRTVPTARLPV